MNADPPGMKHLGPVAERRGQEHDKTEQDAEECDLDGMDTLRHLAHDHPHDGQQGGKQGRVEHRKKSGPGHMRAPGHAPACNSIVTGFPEILNLSVYDCTGRIIVAGAGPGQSQTPDRIRAPIIGTKKYRPKRAGPSEINTGPIGPVGRKFRRRIDFAGGSSPVRSAAHPSE